MNKMMDISDICQLVTSQLHAVFGFYNVTIMLADHPNQELVATANAGAFDPLVVVNQYRQSFAKGIMGQVVRMGQPLIINDTRLNPNFFELPEMKIRSEAALPIIANQKIIGVLNIDSEHLHTFGDREIGLLTTIASQLSTALERARLFTETHRRAQQLEALRQASLSVTARLELPNVLQALSGAAMGLLPAIRGIHIYTYDDAEDRVSFGTVLWADGRKETPYDNPQPGGLAYTVAQTGEVIIAPDARTHPLLEGLIPEDLAITLAVLPLKIGQHINGVMVVSRSQLDAFSDEDLELIHLLADQAAIAIENARLYKQAQEEVEERKRAELSLRQRNVTLELLADISRSMAVPLSINRILDSVARLTAQALDFTSVYICDWDAETGLSTVLAEYISPEASPLEKESDLGEVYDLAEDFEDTVDWLQDKQSLQNRLRR